MLSTLVGYCDLKSSRGVLRVNEVLKTGWQRLELGRIYTGRFTMENTEMVLVILP